MSLFLVVVKLLCLLIAIMYSISIIIKTIYGHRVHAIQVFLFAIGIVGFVTIHFQLWQTH